MLFGWFNKKPPKSIPLGVLVYSVFLKSSTNIPFEQSLARKWSMLAGSWLKQCRWCSEFLELSNHSRSTETYLPVMGGCFGELHSCSKSSSYRNQKPKWTCNEQVILWRSFSRQAKKNIAIHILKLSWKPKTASFYLLKKTRTYVPPYPPLQKLARHKPNQPTHSPPAQALVAPLAPWPCKRAKFSENGLQTYQPKAKCSWKT